ncbi:MAG: hypothetical protein MJ219_01225 [Mycoplasmoidaceae bacterium]|nr:hypothetical protein [Mycoplasmoidaceae bacterium]
MIDKQQTKIFNSINDLKDLSLIPEGEKKKVMRKNITLLDEYMLLYKHA